MYENVRFARPASGATAARHFSDERGTATVLLPRTASHTARVNITSLSCYYRYLSANLAFPFRIWYPEPTLPDEADEYPCKALRLIDPQSGIGDEIDGIYCTVRKGDYERNLPLIELELPPEDPNFDVVEEYWDWFWNCGASA